MCVLKRTAINLLMVIENPIGCRCCALLRFERIWNCVAIANVC